MKCEEKTYKIVFDNAKLFLNEMAPKDINLKEYLQRKKEFANLKDVFERLIESLVNRGMMPNVVKFKERKSEFKKNFASLYK